MQISMKLFFEYIVIFFHLFPTSNHLHQLQVENYDSNSRLVVYEDDYIVNSGSKRLSTATNIVYAICNLLYIHIILPTFGVLLQMAG